MNDLENSDVGADELTTYKLEEPIYQYHTDDVEQRQFLKLYARGSSRKEVYDNNEKLIVYFLHEGKIYSWTSLSKESKNDDIVLVSKTTSTELLAISHGQYIFLEDIYDQLGKLCR